MNLEQRVANLEKQVANLKRQLENQPNPLEPISESIRLAELRKLRLQKHFKKTTDPEQRQALLNAVTRLDCYVQSLQSRYQY